MDDSKKSIKIYPMIDVKISFFEEILIPLDFWKKTCFMCPQNDVILDKST